MRSMEPPQPKIRYPPILADYEMGTRTEPLRCGQGPPFGNFDHRFLTKFRHRRLLSYLWVQGRDAAFQSMLHQVTAFFCVPYLEMLASQGQWADAVRYVCPRFICPESTCTELSPPASLQAYVFLAFLRMHCVIYSRHASQDDINWGRAWSKAAEILRDLACKTPELKERLLLSDDRMGPQDVLPIGFGLASFRRRRCLKTRDPRPRPSAITKLYLHKRKSLPSSGQCSSLQELSPTEFKTKAQRWVTDLLDECGFAGKFPDQYQGFNPLAMEGV